MVAEYRLIEYAVRIILLIGLINCRHVITSLLQVVTPFGLLSLSLAIINNMIITTTGYITIVTPSLLSLADGYT